MYIIKRKNTRASAPYFLYSHYITFKNKYFSRIAGTRYEKQNDPYGYYKACYTVQTFPNFDLKENNYFEMLKYK